MMRIVLLRTIMNPMIYRPLTWVLTIVAVLSYLAIPLFPLYGEKNYIAENAMAPSNHISLFSPSKYYEILDQLKKHPGSTLDYIEKFYKQRDMTPYYQNFTTKVSSDSGTLYKTGVNLFGILHPPRAQRDECNVVMFRHHNKNKLAEIAFSLAFLDMLATNREINYLSRSIIFLAYDGKYRSNGKAALAFLDSYFRGHVQPPKTDFPRCGILRQAVNIEMDEDNFNRVILINDGLNGQLNDFDYYMNFNQMLNEHLLGYWSLDEDLKYETMVDHFLQRNYIHPLLRLANQGHHNYYLAQTLATFKRRIVGRTDYAHSYFMEYGIHAVTLRGIKFNYEPKSSEPKSSEIMHKLGKVLETTNRANMVLQEQLHAGSPLYVTLDLNNHITIGRFIYPFIFFQFAAAQIVAAYLQSKKKNLLFKWTWSSVTYAISGVILYFLPTWIEMAWNKIVDTKAYFSYDGREELASLDLSSALTIWFLGLAAATLLIVRPMLEKVGYTIFEHYTKPAPNEVLNLDEEWIIAYAFPLVYICLGGTMWLIVNLPFGILSVLLLQPLIILVKPVKKRYWLNNIAFFVFVALEIQLAVWLIQTFDINIFDTIKFILGLQSRYVSSLWSYLTLTVIPGLGMIMNLLFFHYRNRV